MKQIKGIAVLLLTVLLLSGCGAANRNEYGSVVAATYGDRTIYLDEANFWLRKAELDNSYYVSYYAQLLGIDFWSAESGRRTQTCAESLKEDIMAEFRQINILLDHASEYDTELTEDELKKIDDSIAELKTYYSTYLFSESVIGSYSDEALKQSLITRSQALKVWNGVREQASVNVSDEDCKSFTLQYFLVQDSSSATVGETTITGQDLADLLESELKDGTSFEDLKKTFSSLSSGTLSYRRNDTETTSQLFTVGKDMLTGQVLKFTDSSSSSTYYVTVCVSSDDADAAVKARADLESRQKEDHFEEVFAEWQKAAKSFSVKSAFDSLPLPDEQ